TPKNQLIKYSRPAPKFAIIGGTFSSADKPCSSPPTVNIWPPIISPQTKQIHTAPPIISARSQWPCNKWPAPGTSQPTAPMAQARGGACSTATSLVFSFCTHNLLIDSKLFVKVIRQLTANWFRLLH